MNKKILLFCFVMILLARSFASAKSFSINAGGDFALGCQILKKG